MEAATDLNGDGLMDLVECGPQPVGEDQYDLYLRCEHMPSFDFPVDANFDGIKDRLTYHVSETTGEHTLGIAYGQGGGSFGAEQALTFGQLTTMNMDIDGDGNADAGITTSHSSGFTAADGTSVPTSCKLHAEGTNHALYMGLSKLTSSDEYGNVFEDDINGDGTADFVQRQSDTKSFVAIQGVERK